MIRITLMDGTQLEIPREEALELLPYQNVFRNPNLKAPVDGLFSYRGKLTPVLGPLPAGHVATSLDGRPWLLLMKGCAQAIQGLPDFVEAEASASTPTNVIPFETQAGKDEEKELLSELDDLLKTA